MSRIYLSLKIFYCYCNICRYRKIKAFSIRDIQRPESLQFLLFRSWKDYATFDLKTNCSELYAWSRSATLVRVSTKKEFLQSTRNCWCCWDQFQLLHPKVFFNLVLSQAHYASVVLRFLASSDIITSYWTTDNLVQSLIACSSSDSNIGDIESRDLKLSRNLLKISGIDS